MNQRTCDTDGCDRKHMARGMCVSHYSAWMRNGQVATPLREKQATCTIDGCDGVHQAKGYCRKHYSRFQRHGDPHITHARHSWLGDDVGYQAVHSRIWRSYGAASQYACVDCGEQARDWAYNRGAPDERIDATYGYPFSTDLAYYSPRCKMCHNILDHPLSLSVDDVRRLRAEALKVNNNYAELGRQFGISHQYARALCLGINGAAYEHGVKVSNGGKVERFG